MAGELKIKLNKEEMEEGEIFKYLRLVLNAYIERGRSQGRRKNEGYFEESTKGKQCL